MNDNDRKRISVIDTPYFRSPTGFSIWFWSTLLRLALFVGHPVVLVGACRSGKSLLLHKLTPNKVIDKTGVAIRCGGGPYVLAEDEIPTSPYGIDEAQLIEPDYLNNLAKTAAINQRAFCLAAQLYTSIEGAIDSYCATPSSKRLILVVVGGKKNPRHLLESLPNQRPQPSPPWV